MRRGGRDPCAAALTTSTLSTSTDSAGNCTLRDAILGDYEPFGTWVGRSKTLKTLLNRTGKLLLAACHRLNVRVVIAAGHRTALTRTITFKATPAHQR